KWSGHTVALLSRQADGSFAAALDLNRHQPATRYFQVAARYTSSPFSRMSGRDLRVIASTGSSASSTSPITDEVPGISDYSQPLHKTGSHTFAGTATLRGYLHLWTSVP